MRRSCSRPMQNEAPVVEGRRSGLIRMLGEEWVLAMCIVSPGVLACASVHGHLDVWDVRTGECRRLTHRAGVGAICMVSTDVLASTWCVDETVVLWDVRTGACVRTLAGHSGFVTSMCMVSAGVLATGSTDRTVKLWDVRTGACIRTLTGHTDVVHSLCMMPAGVLASGSCDDSGSVKLWNLRTGACRSLAIQYHVHSVCLVSATVLACSTSSTIQLWDVHRQIRVRVLLTPHRQRIMLGDICMVSTVVLAGVTASPDDRAMLWDVRTGQFIGTLTGRTGAQAAACVVSAGILAVACHDTVKVWNIGADECHDVNACKLWDEIDNPGSAYTSQLLWPGETRVTYSQSAFAIVCATIRRNARSTRVCPANGYLHIPVRALHVVAEYV